MQALPLNGSGTEAKSGSANVTDRHQHATSKEPAAETAHPFGVPQIGQSGA